MFFNDDDFVFQCQYANRKPDFNKLDALFYDFFCLKSKRIKLGKTMSKKGRAMMKPPITAIAKG